MGAVNLGIRFDQRSAAETPVVHVTNLILEPSLTNEVDQKTWLLRPGAEVYPSPQSGPLRGLLRSTSAYPNALFIVQGPHLYTQDMTSNAATIIGPVAGNDRVIFAYHNNVILLSAASIAYRYDGSTFAPITMPDGELISWVAYLAGYFLLGVRDSQHIFFMTDTASAPDALDFFSAETHSTNTVRAMVLNDQLVIFCDENTEFWQPSGDLDLPFSRIVGQGYEKGLQGSQSIAAIDNTLMFVGNDYVVYRVEQVPLRVSTNSIEERLRRAVAVFVDNNQGTVFQAWTMLADGHAYFVLTIDNQGTFVYDVSTQEWLSWNSNDSNFWLCSYGVSFDGFLTLGASYADNFIYQITPDLGADNGNPIDWVLTGAVPILGPSQRLDSLTLMTNAGHGGSFQNPVTVDLRISNDQGQSFIGPFTVSAGVPGDFAAVPTWRMMGQMKQPQCILEFSGSVTSPFRISYARYNESFAP